MQQKTRVSGLVDSRKVSCPSGSSSLLFFFSRLLFSLFTRFLSFHFVSFRFVSPLSHKYNGYIQFSDKLKSKVLLSVRRNKNETFIFLPYIFFIYCIYISYIYVYIFNLEIICIDIKIDSFLNILYFIFYIFNLFFFFL